MATDLDFEWSWSGNDQGHIDSVSFWVQIKELLKKLEQLSEEVLAVRGDNARLALQLQVCLVLGRWALLKRRVHSGSDVSVREILGIQRSSGGLG